MRSTITENFFIHFSFLSFSPYLESLQKTYPSAELPTMVAISESIYYAFFPITQATVAKADRSASTTHTNVPSSSYAEELSIPILPVSEDQHIQSLFLCTVMSPCLILCLKSKNVASSTDAVELGSFRLPPSKEMFRTRKVWCKHFFFVSGTPYLALRRDISSMHL